MAEVINIINGHAIPLWKMALNHILCFLLYKFIDIRTILKFILIIIHQTTHLSTIIMGKSYYEILGVSESASKE